MAGKIKFQIWHLFIYLCRNFIVFVVNLVYLYIKLRSVTLFLKFIQFVTKRVNYFKKLTIFYVDLASPGYLGLTNFQTIDSLTFARLLNFLLV